ncbi:MAG: hypothetical protein ACREBD_18710, partial [Blastocatellia bacterium]
FWAKPRWMAIPDFYYFLLAPAALPLMALLVLSAIYPQTRNAINNSLRRIDKYPPAPSLHEMAAAFGFMALPVFAVTLSKFVTGAYTDRYALPAVIGCSIIIATAAHRLLHDRPAIAAPLMFSLCGFFLLLGVKSVTNNAEVLEAQTRTIEFLRSAGMSDLPIAITDQHAFTSLAHYAPPDVASRLVYLADPDRSLSYLGHNSVEKGAIDLLKPWFHLPIEEYGPYVASQKRFLVYGAAGHFLNWLLPDLAKGNRRVELRGRNKASLLFLVGPEEHSSDREAPRHKVAASQTK